MLPHILCEIEWKVQSRGRTGMRGITELDVLYVDNHVLAVVKPAGLLSQGDITGDPCLLEIARAWVKREFDKPGNVFLGLVHRLDRPVGGIMVFARTSKAASRLSAQFRNRTIEKEYKAVVLGTPIPGDQTLTGTFEGKFESLRFATLETGPKSSLLAVYPKTGRKHQIRRQLKDAGHPVCGDLRYGAPTPLPQKQIALFAHALTVEHPTQQERIRFQAPLPAWWPALR